MAFESDAPNLVAGVDNSQRQVYIRDIGTGVTRLASASSGNIPGNLGSRYASMSDDGRYVAFVSEATNLVANDTNAAPDVFVRDVTAGVTTRVSVSSTGTQANAGASLVNIFMSADGRYVAFHSASTNLVSQGSFSSGQVYVRDRTNGTTKVGSANSSGVAANNDSEISAAGALSRDGRYLVFSSIASNLVSGDTNAHYDSFVRDMTTGAIRRFSMNANGAQLTNHNTQAVISADGQVVSWVQDGVALHVRTRSTGAVLARLPAGPNGPVLSANGKRISYYAIAANGTNQSYVKDLPSGTPLQITAPYNGTAGVGGGYVGDLSSDGRTVTFFSDSQDITAAGSGGAFQVYTRSLSAP
ncbi:MAG TPA: hypothetical protein VK453_05390 [Micromonosporaceae bacterium]|nr:hypothetical protein [Micromonosporaceae bacterium]